MRAGSRWKAFRRRLRYWLDHSERQRLLWEEMEFHIGSDSGVGAQGMSAPDARAAAHRKFGNMTQRSKRLALPGSLEDGRLGTGFAPLVSRHASRRRIYG